MSGVFRIESVYMGRIITSYLLTGKHALLIDSGFAFTPREKIFPYINQIGIPIEQIKWLVNTHASGDHFGGNYAIKNLSPQTKIVAHRLDADSIEDYDTFLREHKEWTRDYGLTCTPVHVNDPQFVSLHGPETQVDERVSGGEKLVLEPGWEVTLIHSPGHTPGHLIIYDCKNKGVFIGDAVLGFGVPDIDGNLVMPPHYFEVDWYMQTIEKMRALNPSFILATHYSPFFGEDAIQFIDESESFLNGCEESSIHIFKQFGRPIDAPFFVKKLRETIGIPDSDNQYNLLARAHLNKLVQEGKAIPLVEKGMKKWQLIK